MSNKSDRTVGSVRISWRGLPGLIPINPWRNQKNWGKGGADQVARNKLDVHISCQVRFTTSRVRTRANSEAKVIHTVVIILVLQSL
jgi:hypothetical protein